jgi:hypothetical protein
MQLDQNFDDWKHDSLVIEQKLKPKTWKEKVHTNHVP